MVRKLLADRFQLAFHRDTREISVYTLTVEKTGTKLTKSEGDLDRLAGMGFRGRPGAFFPMTETWPTSQVSCRPQWLIGPLSTKREFRVGSTLRSIGRRMSLNWRDSVSRPLSSGGRWIADVPMAGVAARGTSQAGCAEGAFADGARAQYRRAEGYGHAHATGNTYQSLDRDQPNNTIPTGSTTALRVASPITPVPVERPGIKISANSTVRVIAA